MKKSDMADGNIGKLFKGLPRQMPPAGMDSRIMEAVRAAEVSRQQRRLRRRERRFETFALAGMLAAFFAVIYFILPKMAGESGQMGGGEPGVELSPVDMAGGMDRLWSGLNAVDPSFMTMPVVIAVCVLGLLLLDIVVRKKYVKDHFHQ